MIVYQTYPSRMGTHTSQCMVPGSVVSNTNHYTTEVLTPVWSLEIMRSSWEENSDISKYTSFSLIPSKYKIVKFIF